MLKARIITALALLMLFIPALLNPVHEYWWSLTLVLMVLAAWEWGRAVQARAMSPSHTHEPAAPSAVSSSSLPLPSVEVSDPHALLGYALGTATALVGWGIWQQLGFAAFPQSASWLLGGLWLYFFSFLFWGGAVRWARVPLGLKAWGGWCVLVGTWWSIAVAKEVGSGFLLSVLCVVWVADVAAYFGGKAFGRHKLAPVLSPGKTWEGVASGLMGVYLLAYAWLNCVVFQELGADSVFALLSSQGLGVSAMGLAVLVMFSVMGDLFESMVKRSAGIKDSSHLLPGHGGVLDRVDALLPTLPLAVTMLTWFR